MSEKTSYKPLTKKIAKDIALTSFDYVTDCLLGVSDSEYNLGTDVSEFEANFEEDLEEKGINPTAGKIKLIMKYFEIERAKLKKVINKPRVRHG